MDRIECFRTIVSYLSQDINTVQKFAEHLDELFLFIDCEKIGAEFSNAVKDSNYSKAVHLCAEYFRNRKKPDLEIGQISSMRECDITAARKSVKGIARVINIDWEFPNGEVDFLFDPTEIKGPRNHEWLWQFNRHDHWGNLARAYSKTGEEIFASTFAKELRKWIAQTEITENWNGPGSAWRTIECGLRLLGNWLISFDGFKKSESVDDVTLLLMIASMHRQAVHLVKNPTGENWLMMESNGVYAFSAVFPEFKDSDSNRKLAAERLLREMKLQTLPDGVHNELSPDYRYVVFRCVSNFYSLSKAFGFSEEISGEFVELIKKSVNVAIMLSTPAFTQPRTNDSYTIPTSYFTKQAESMFGFSPEYRYVNSKRKEGNPPENIGTSVFFPYSGFAVMRSDWGEDASYLCFDVGPLGVAHIHQDKLNINLFKGNRELIFDDGGGQYEISDFRKYAISGYDHNTILVDGMAQNRTAPKYCEEPIDAGWIIGEDFDYAVGVYDDGYGYNQIKSAVHKREIRFCKPDVFVVSDTVTSTDDSAHDYELLFHLDTLKIKQIPQFGNAVMSDYGDDYEVLIIPFDEEGKKVDLIIATGETEPCVRGWYNGRNESNLHKATTVSRKVCGVKNFRFNTLLIPIKAGTPIPEIVFSDDNLISLCFNGKEYNINLAELNK